LTRSPFAFFASPLKRKLEFFKKLNMCDTNLQSEQTTWNTIILSLLKMKTLHITLCEMYDYASIEVDMPDVETSTQEVDVSQPMDIQEEDGNNNASLMLLRTLMDIHIVVTRHVTSTETVSRTVISESSKGKMYKQKTRGSYRRYTVPQIEQSFDT
jgi:hypothetical protein